MPIVVSHGSEEEAAAPSDFALQMITDGFISPASAAMDDAMFALSMIQNGLVWPVE